jgi:hypothetical protein
LIYRTMLFGLRNGFGMHRKVIGMPEGVPEAPGEYWALVGQVEGNTPAHMGWCAPLRQPHLIHGKGRRHPLTIFRRREEGKKGAPPPFLPPYAIIWQGAHQREEPWGCRHTFWGALGAASFPPTPIYMWGGVPHNTQLIPRRVSAPLRSSSSQRLGEALRDYFTTTITTPLC